jgi:hypothetical protein
MSLHCCIPVTFALLTSCSMHSVSSWLPTSVQGISSSLPSRLDKHFLRGNLQISSKTKDGQHSASAVLLGNRLLATAKHFWLGCVECPSKDHQGTKHVRLYVPDVGYIATRCSLVCEGAGQGATDDWVLLEPVAGESWPTDAAERVAHVLPAEVWTDSSNSSPVWLVGYPAGIGHPLPETRDGTGITFSIPQADNTEDGPWVVTGNPIQATEHVCMTYNSDWHPPVGASGGGMYFFNPYSGRAELVALFTDYQWGLLSGARLSGIPIWTILQQWEHSRPAAAQSTTPPTSPPTTQL